jgi:hypothetical protein
MACMPQLQQQLTVCIQVVIECGGGHMAIAAICRILQWPSHRQNARFKPLMAIVEALSSRHSSCTMLVAHSTTTAVHQLNSV